MGTLLTVGRGRGCMDPSSRRGDVPVLRDTGIVYLDSACMALKPDQVIDAVREYHTEFPACAGRSQHRLGERATGAVEEARDRVAEFLGADGLVFTRNTTEAVNLVAHALAPETVVTSDREHNSNLVPWQEHATEHRIVSSRADETFDLDAFRREMDDAVDLVSVVHTSNLDGYTLPVREIAEVAHDHGALVLVDAAQSAAHRPVNLHDLGADLLAVSGHKLSGASGTGALAVRNGVEEELGTFMVGGETVTSTTYTAADYAEFPQRLEAGLQDYGGIHGFAAAVGYLEEMGMAEVREHEAELGSALRDRVRAVDGAELVGADAEGGIATFTIEGMDAHEVAMLLDRTDDVAVRSGMHCGHAWYRDRGRDPTVRASLGWYSTAEDVERFGDALERVAGVR